MKELQLKNTQIKVVGTLPTEVTNLTEVLAEVENTTEAKKLLSPVKQYSEALLKLTTAEKGLKEAVKVETDKVKQAKEALKTIEASIKEKALELVDVTVETKFNKTTGVAKEVETNNLPFGFSFTSEKVSKAVNFESLQAEIIKTFIDSHKDLDLTDSQDLSFERVLNGNIYYVGNIKIVAELNKAEIAKAVEAGVEFEMKTITKPESISIQGKALTDVMNQEKIKLLIGEGK